MSRAAALAGFLVRLGARTAPGVLELVDLALTHRSHAMESSTPGDNERLELLGDAVVGLVTTEYLYTRHPAEPEGPLSKRKAAMVSRATLGMVAAELGIGQLLQLGAGEDRAGGRTRTSVLGGALEAVLGALHLTHSFEETRAVILAHVIPRAESLCEDASSTDFKSRFQEWTQRQFQRTPEYRLTGTHGPEHQKNFVVEVWFDGTLWATGQGVRRKAAENDAARLALERIPRT